MLGFLIACGDTLGQNSSLIKVIAVNFILRTCYVVGILVKGMYELWGEGGNYEELEESIRNYPDERKLPYLEPNSTFKINVDTFGKVISLVEQNQRIQGLNYIPFKVRFLM